MQTLTRIAFTSLLASASAACVPNGPITEPASCHDLSVGVYGEGLPDGLYTLYIDKDPSMPWVAYCADNATATPTEYLPLAPVDNINFSETTDGKTNVRTSFSMVRFDITTLKVDISDLRFATTTSNDPVAGAPVPFGVAVSTHPDYTAHANIDLRGTQFVVASAFTLAGDAAGGPSRDGRVVELKSGYRGFAVPDGVEVARTQVSTGYVELDYVPCANLVDGVCQDAEELASGTIDPATVGELVDPASIDE